MLKLLLCLILLGQTSTSASPGNQPFEPFRIADNLYYVGATDIASYLITTPQGHILVDAGYDTTVPLIERNVAALGFKMTDVKILLNTHAHTDHAGGLAAMKTLTGATLMVEERDADLIERGGRGDFAFGDCLTFPPARVDRRLADGAIVRLGGAALTARLTPGHTKGCTTWTFTATDHGTSYRVVIVASPTINPGVRLVRSPSYPGIAGDYAKTFALLKALPCDIFLGPHASFFNMQEKAARARRGGSQTNAFVDPDGYRRFVARSEQAYLAQMASERQGASK